MIVEGKEISIKLGDQFIFYEHRIGEAVETSVQVISGSEQGPCNKLYWGRTGRLDDKFVLPGVYPSDIADFISDLICKKIKHDKTERVAADQWKHYYIVA